MSNTNKQIETLGGVVDIPLEFLPKGWKKLTNSHVFGDNNFGNVEDKKGSKMVCIKKFYFRWKRDNKPKISYYPKRKYNLHLAFIDAGKEVDYIFVDKYECGNLDGIFTSSKELKPCSTSSYKNPISELKNNPDNNFGGLYAAAKTRGKKHFLTSALIWNALGILKFVHNNYKLEQTEFHNNHKCGVKWINPYRYEVASGLTKFDDESNIFKVLKQNISYRDLKDADTAYNEDLYDDLDLTDIMENCNNFMFLDDKVKTFSNKNLVKTCFGIPKSNALSEDSNPTYGKAGIYLYKRAGLAVLVGGTWRYTSNAGVFCMYLSDSRTASYYTVGGRASYFVTCSVNDSEQDSLTREKNDSEYETK
ncbi:hypothetical protein [Aliarcobacter butzleri]|uniref:hypothetical protein n=1 Tax=Aliarcobacter butzleri TaxID=28197 RepID=UPI00125F87CF|nr:hypothetical protein [Aliarcobacter butzleri]